MMNDHPKTIFYLDDDSDDLYFFKNAASSLGHKIMVFHCGDEMLKTLRASSEKPQIIFLDVQMPILNGEEILNILKKSHLYKQIPVVMISSFYPKKLVRKLMEAGADYLIKKGSVSDLKNTLENILQIAFKDEKLSA